MATLEKRVQVLFSAEQYARLEAEARAEQMSVGAYVREAVDGWMDRKRVDAQAALTQLFAWADENPVPGITPEYWEAHKEDLLNRPSLGQIR
ncbi:hypothetical protein Q9R19_11140 [Microbacterium sp. ARD32]|uniref:hypothetical protein n=1 Tax=Microbacterium sp. ARD32 TaxID=2962577 RepID=UPI0028811D9E|nr:hypothetical protein [Microbacterium sp. ARD32]MDT0158180.1 hypothetical protein [Microbacterium sp. ARD32]